MSIKVMTWVWANSPYSGERLLLHLALADFANDEGICFPSHSTLAKKARCSTGWVAQTIKQMQKDALIEIVEPAGMGRGKVGRYRLTKGLTELDLNEEKGLTATQNRSNSDASDSSLLNRHESSNTQSEFDRLWKCYPRKTAKGAAQRAFERLMKRTDAPSVDVLIAAVERYASTIKDMNFCAHLATWLNGERWLDETTTTTAQAVETKIVAADVRTAENLAAAFVHTRRSEEQLLESLQPYSLAARDAALALFRDMKAGNA